MLSILISVPSTYYLGLLALVPSVRQTLLTLFIGIKRLLLYLFLMIKEPEEKPLAL
jgi:hypothetical protein